MPFSHFEPEQIIPLILSGVILISSVLLFQKHKNISLSLLFIGTLCLGYFIANLDHFLTLWDEQYHALVAKNLSKDFLKPMLYTDPVLGFDYKNWTSNQIWLHKQPLFLWQMALSIKLFGATEMAIRIPSIVMHAIIPLFIYRVGKIIKNEETGYYGALLFAVAYFPLELVAGGYSTDHNDVAFLFYVTASFWAWFEYQKSQNKKWLILIGVFSGCAVLVKWLMGLLIYVIWIITKTIVNPKQVFKAKSYLPMLSSALVSLIVFLPWQIYILTKYPIESAYEYKLNSAHFFQVVEGHAQSTWFHFVDARNLIYGSGAVIPFILLFGLIYLTLKIPNKTYKVALVSSVVFVYAFYTLATTKMISFTLIVGPFIYLGLGHLIGSLNLWIRKKLKIKILASVLVVLIPISAAYTALNLRKIENYHTDWKPRDNRNRAAEEMEMRFINSLKDQVDGQYVIFNASLTVNGHIPVMFYTDNVAYYFIPTPSQIEMVKEQNRKVAVVDLGVLPDYILDDQSIKILKVDGRLN